MKRRQCLLCQLSGLTPAPAWFLEAAPPSGGCVVRSLACRRRDAFLVLLYLTGSLESEAWQRNKPSKLAHGFTGYNSVLQRRGMKPITGIHIPVEQKLGNKECIFRNIISNTKVREVTLQLAAITAACILSLFSPSIICFFNYLK